MIQTLNQRHSLWRSLTQSISRKPKSRFGIILILLLTSALSAPQLMAQCTDGLSGGGTNGALTSVSVGQTFSPSCSGTLNTISVISNSAHTGITVTLYEGAVASGSNLAQLTNQTITRETSSLSNFSTTFDFSGSSVAMDPTKTYTFIISGSSIDLFHHVAGTYGDGIMVFDNSFTAAAARDLNFQVDIVAGASNTDPTQNANTGSSLSEGGTDVVSSSELDFDDAEEADTDITYTLDNVPSNGSLRKSTVALTAGGSFTQDDLNNNLIDYVHNGTNTTSDSFQFDVSDGAGGSVDNVTFTFTIAAVDDDTPTVSTNTGITVAEGGTETINNSELAATDTDTDDATLTFSITSGVSNGIIQLTTNTGVNVSSFTQDDVDNNRVQYVHNGGNTTSDSFTATVQDGSGNNLTNQTFSITVTAVDDDTPSLSTNTGITVAEGGTETINNTELAATDTDTDDATLTFSITSGVSNGIIQLTTNTGVNVSSFTQDDVDNNRVQYVHNGGNTTSDSFTATVQDGSGNNLTNQTFNITVTAVDDDTPSLSTNTGITVAEGGTETINNTELAATDTDTDDATLTFSITSGVSNGIIQLTTNTGVNVSSFTQDDVDNNRVQYVHNGGNTTSDSFTATVQDGSGNNLTNQTFNITVTAVDDDTPTVSTNTGITVAEGGTETINNSELAATDTDTDDATLTFSITSGVSNGIIQLTTNTGVNVSSFTQDDVDNNRVQYVHDGTNTTSDSFTATVQDGSGNNLTNQTFSITVTGVNDTPSFTIGSNQTFSQSATAQTIPGHTTNISDNDGNTQTLTFNVSNDNNGIFTVQPDIDESTGNLTFTPNSSAFGKATVTVNLEDDGGGSNQSANQTFDIFITPDNIRINEVDASSTGEFVEIYDGGSGTTSLTDLFLVFYNGSSDTQLRDIDLTGSTDANGFYVIGETGVTNLDQDWGGAELQEGPDAVALFVGSASDFTNGSAITMDGLVDAVVYDTDDVDDAGLLSGLGQSTQFNENENGNASSESISRSPDGTGGFVIQAITPGVANDVTAPTLTNQALAQTATNALQITYQSDETGTLYYVVTTDNSSAPTAAQIKAGNDQSGGTTNVLTSGNASVTVTGSDQTVALNSLTLTSTTYHVYLYQEDGANNESSVVTANVTADVTAPTLTSVTLASSQTASEDFADASHATTGNLITLAFTASEALNANPTVGMSVGGTGVTPTINDLGSNNYSATYTLLGTENNGAVTFTIDFTDAAGNAGTQVTATTNSSSIEADFIAPTLPTVSLASSQTASEDFADASHATTGNLITLSFTMDDDLSSSAASNPSVTMSIGGTGVTPTINDLGSNNYSATYTLLGSENEGAVTFTIDFIDDAGISGTQVTATTDASSVEADFNAPTLTTVSIASSQTATETFVDASHASDGNTVTIDITSSDVLSALPTVGIQSGGVNVQGPVTVAHDNPGAPDFQNFNVTYAVDGVGSNPGTDKDADGNITFTIDFTDDAGIAGTQVTATTDATSVEVDNTAPVISEITAVTTPGNNNTPSYTFTTNETGTFAVGGSAGTSTSTTISSTGNQTITFTQTDNTTALADGDYTNVTITVTDAAGNSSNVLAVTNFTVDTSAPSFNSVTDGDDGNYRSGQTVTITADLAEAGLTVTADLTVLDSDLSATAAMTDNTDGTYTITTAALDAGGNMAEGTAIAVTVTATDAAGNSADNSTLSLLLDETAPATFTVGTVALFGGTVVAGQWNSTNTSIDINVPIANDASLENGSIQLRADVASGGFEDLGSAVTISNSDLGSTVTINILAGTFEALSGGLSEGETVTFNAILTDLAGNATTGTASSTTVVFDESAPAAFTVGTVTTNGGTVVAGVWNGTNTDIDITVPIANDASLENGSIQLRADVDGGGFEDLGSAVTISNSDLGTSVTVNILAATFEAISGGLADGETVTFNAILTDAAGNATTGTASATTVDIDQTAPTIAISTPIEGDGVINASEDGDVTISGSTTGVADGGTVNISFSDGSSAPVTGTASVLSSAWTITTDANISGLINGAITITADVSDAAGNAAMQASQTVVLDNGIPSVTVTTPASAVTVNAPNQTIEGTSDEDGATINVYLDSNNDGVQEGSSLGSNVVSGGTWSISVSLTADQENNFVVQASDAAGNASGDVDVPTITEDSSDPASPVVNTPASATSVNAATATIGGTHSEDGVTVNVYADADNDGLIDTPTPLDSDVVSGGSWTVTVSLSEDQANNYLVQAEDDAGNTSGEVDVPTITEDSTNPTISITTPIEGDGVVSAAEAADVEISGSTVGVEDGQSVTVSFSDGTTTAGPVNATVTSNAWTASVADISGLSDGNITVTADVSDLAGNAATQASQTITLDAAAPANPVVTTPASATSVNAATATISGTHTEDGVVVHAYADSNNDGVADNTSSLGSATVSSNAWSFSVNLTADTENNFVVQAVDGAGNVSSDVDVPTITEDSQNPGNPVVTTPASATTVNAGTATISGTHTEDGVVVHAYADSNNDGVADNTSSLGSATVSSNAWSFSVNLTADTDNNFVVQAVDAAGNVSSDVDVPTITEDSVVPTVTNVSSSTANSNFKDTDVIVVTVQFSEVVNVTGTPQIELETGSSGRQATYTTGSGTNTLSFSFTVQVGDNAADLGYVSTAALTLNGGTIQDDAQNDATLTLPTPGGANSLASNKDLVVDTNTPTLTSVSASTADGSYNAGDVIAITVTFDEAVNVTGTPQLELETGTTDRQASFASGTGTTTLTFNYTVQAGDETSDLGYTSTSALTLNGGTINDPTGNAASLGLPSSASANSLVSNKDIIIDTTAPTVTNVTASTADGTYGAGSLVTVQVVFDEVVNVTGTPTLELELGDTDQTASYNTGSGSNTLDFTYTIQTGDVSSDLDYTGTGALALNGGSVKDVAENDATLTLASPGAAGSLGVNKDIVISALPTVSLSVGTANIAEAAGTSTITATLSAASTANVTVALGYTGTATSGVDYNSGGAPSATITINAGQTSASAAVGLTADQDTDGEGNETIVIDITGVTNGTEDGAQQQTVTILDDDAATVVGVSSTTADGSYKAGDVIAIEVTFNQAVDVTGTPQLTLETGTTDQVVDYVSGSSTTVLLFNYTVQAGDESADLDYVATTSLALNGGTIQNTGLDAILTLATPGDANSLGANNALVIDTSTPAAPTVSSITTDTGTSAADQVTNDNTLSFVGTAEANSTVEVFIGGSSIGTTTADGSGNFTFDHSGTTLSDATISVTATATDAAGNTSSASSALSVTVDTVSPLGPSVDAISTDTNVNTDFTTSDNTLTITGTAEANAIVEVFVDNTTTAVGTVNADGSGNFSFDYTANTFSDGTYALFARATDAAGNTGNFGTSSTLVVDTSTPAAPTVSSITTDSGADGADGITNDNTLAFNGTAEANSTVEVFIGGTSIGTTTADGSGNFSYDHSGTTLADATYSITATATDLAGNTSSASSALSVTVDTSAPTAPVLSSITTDSGTNGADQITSDNTLAFNGTAEANSTVEVFIGGTSIGTTTADGSGNFTYDHTGTTLADATYAVTATATDAAGNTSTAGSLNVTVDTTAPSAPVFTGITTDSGSDATDEITNDNTLSFNGTAEANSTVEVFIGGTSIGTTTADGSGNFSYDHTATTLADATYSVTAKATDASGNTSAESSALSVNVDTSAPAAPVVSSITTDSGSSTTDQITNDNTLLFNGTAEANSTVEVFIGGTSIGTTTADGSGNFSFDHTGTTLADGDYSITAAATDAAGNTGTTSAALAITVDAATPAKPVITGISTDSGSNTTDGVTNDNTLVINGTAEAGTSVEVFLGGTSIGTVTADGSGNFSFDHTGTTLADGSQSFTVKATDTSGNTSDESDAFVADVDTSAPATPSVVSITTDTGEANDDEVTGDNTLSFTGTAEASSTVEVFIGGTSIGTTTATGTGDWTFDHTGTTLADGDYQITAQATDLAGNTSTVSNQLSVTVDTGIPSVSITTAAGSLVNGAFNVTVTYSEQVANVDIADVSVSNASTSNFTPVVAGQSWTVDVTPTSDGQVTVQIPAATANDESGNDNTASNTLTLTFDGTPPVVASITRDGATPTPDQEVSYTVTFSEDVNNVDLTDFDTSERDGVTGSSVKSVTPISDSEYTVIVDRGTGEGYYNLELRDDDSITDDAGNPLGGTGTGNGDTSGPEYQTNTSPEDIQLDVNSINENNALLDVIGTLTTTDVDINDTQFSYALVAGTGDDDNGSFEIVVDQLVAGEVFDFETKSTYTVRIQTTDPQGGTFEEVFEITINDVNEVGGLLELSNSEIDEADDPVLVGVLSTLRDPDADETFTYAVESAAGGANNLLFDVVGDELRTVAATNFEENTTLTVGIRSTDSGGNIVDMEFTITINNVENETLRDFTKDEADARVKNFFTPNGDGDNDTWVVEDILDNPINEVKVYSQAGKLIFSQRNYENDWDGTFDGEPIPPGTYYYEINIYNGESIIRGFLTIIRN